jgi:hypothetical protein
MRALSDSLSFYIDDGIVRLVLLFYRLWTLSDAFCSYIDESHCQSLIGNDEEMVLIFVVLDFILSKFD